MKPGEKRKGGEKARTVSLLFLALTMILSGCSHYGTGAGSGSETKDLPSPETERDISDGSEDAAYAPSVMREPGSTSGKRASKPTSRMKKRHGS